MKGTAVLRLVRLLPVLLPLLEVASRNPKVRELLRLKPRTDSRRSSGGER